VVLAGARLVQRHADRAAEERRVQGEDRAAGGAGSAGLRGGNRRGGLRGLGGDRRDVPQEDHGPHLEALGLDHVHGHAPHGGAWGDRGDFDAPQLARGRHARAQEPGGRLARGAIAQLLTEGFGGPPRRGKAAVEGSLLERPDASGGQGAKVSAVVRPGSERGGRWGEGTRWRGSLRSEIARGVVLGALVRGGRFALVRRVFCCPAIRPTVRLGGRRRRKVGGPGGRAGGGESPQQGEGRGGAPSKGSRRRGHQNITEARIQASKPWEVPTRKRLPGALMTVR